MNFYVLIRQFSIRLRMVGAIAVVLVLLGLLGGAGMWGMFRIQQMSESFRHDTLAQAQHLSVLRTQLHSVQRSEQEIWIHHAQPAQVATLTGAWQQEMAKLRAAAQQLMGQSSAADRALLAAMLQRVEGYQRHVASHTSQLSGPNGAAGVVRAAQAAKALLMETDGAVQQLAQSLQAATQQAAVQEERAAAQAQWLFGLAVLITLVVVAPLTLLNMVAICRPIEEARNAALAMAQGDLSQNLDIQGHDEVAKLQSALQQMRHSLGAMVGQVRDATGSIAIASQEIASGNSDLSARTEQTAGNVQETVASITQLTATVQQTAASAHTANQLATSATDIALRGGGVVQQAVQSMEAISTSSRKISDIIGLIDSIAFQTNILALNAAVEAARAGEQGRGFAVVAGEVRSLAQRSAQAANEIKQLIQTSVHAVDGGVRHVQEAGRNMQEMVQSVRQVGDIIAEITAASAEQSAGIGQVHQAVGDIDQMTQQNAALVEQAAAAAQSLREQAQRLTQLVSQFHLEASPAAALHAVPQLTLAAFTAQGSRPHRRVAAISA